MAPLLPCEEHVFVKQTFKIVDTVVAGVGSMKGRERRHTANERSYDVGKSYNQVSSCVLGLPPLVARARFWHSAASL
eukprot:m.21692 g.21692  ORF g.21692 m.21692 type:complete len:77 (+) comp33082_c0_seq2:573-803(+)